MTPFKLSLSMMLVLACVAPSIAEPFFYDETIHGPLSNDRLIPSQLTADAGENVLRGQIDHTYVGDFFTFAVPFDASLTSIVVDSLTNPADFSFAIAAELIDWQDYDAFIYFGETDSSLLGMNLLAELGIPPLNAGSYWFFIGTDDGTMHDYQMTLSINPELPSVVFFAVGLALMTPVRLRHRNPKRAT